MIWARFPHSNNKCTFAAKWNFCIYFLFLLRFFLFLVLLTFLSFVIRILLSFPPLILIADCEFCFPIFIFRDQRVTFSFRLLALLQVLKFTRVVGFKLFSMLHLPFSSRLSVFNFQRLVVGIKSSNYHFAI